MDKKNDFDELLDFVKKCSPKGICILDYSIYDESENTDGTSFRVQVLNPTKKTIKYIWFSIIGYNPVGDKVFERSKQSSSITLKAVGPIEPDKNGTYNFEYAWFTDLVETVKIAQVKVQYMDGSIKIISETNTVKMPKGMYSILTENN